MGDQQVNAGPRLGYGAVFVILAVITAVEVGLGSLGVAPSIRTALFLSMSLAKAAFIAAYFMHLRSDSRLYSYILLAPVLLLVVFVLLAAVP
jgi:caa(3)-type oxidase subunit IV